MKKAKKNLKLKGEKCCHTALEALDKWSNECLDTLEEKVRYFNNSESSPEFKFLEGAMLQKRRIIMEIDQSKLVLIMPLQFEMLKKNLDKSIEKLYKKGQKFDLGSRMIMKDLPGM